MTPTDLERTIICSILLDDSFAYVLDDFGAADFTDFTTVKAMKKMAAENRKIDFVTLALETQTTGSEVLDRYHFLPGVPSNFSAHVAAFREVVAKKRLAGIGNGALMMSGSDASSSEIIVEIEAEIEKIRAIKTEPEVNIKDQAIKATEIMENGVPAVPTRFLDLNRVINGFVPTDLWYVGARPSQGKTALVGNLIFDLVLTKEIGVTFFSIEMPASQILVRMCAAELGMDLHFLLSKNRSGDKDWRRINDLMSKLSKSPLVIEDSTNMPIQRLKQKVRQDKKKNSTQVVFVDYLGRMPLVDLEGFSKADRVAELSRQLKNLAREENVTMVVLSQLSRLSTKENRRPGLADLRDSGALEQDGDIVMFLHEEAGQSELLIEKNRNGPCTILPMSFDREYVRFRERNSIEKKLDGAF